VPSPRQYVVDDAPVPLFKLVTGKLPVTPVDKGKPVALVKVPDDGVPNAPPLTTNAPAEPVLTAKAVATPVPNPDTPVEIGKPVALVSVTLVGVPNIGVTNVGEVANTFDPVPVSSVSADAKLALVGVAKNVAIPVPKPLTPVEIGNPLALVNVPDDGVPKAPPFTTTEPAEPVLTASAVATPVPRPLTPVDMGKPVAFVNVTLVGVPRTGVTKVGLVAKTKDPDPVLSVTAVARLALDGVAKNVAIPVPSPETPVLMGKPVVLVKTPLAGVPSAGAVNVGLVKVTPENVITVAPKATLVDPIVTVELVKAELPMLLKVFVEPLIDLLVSVSVVALPTKVSVLVGNVNVPVFVIVEITGLVNVLFVSVCVPVRVATTLVSIAIVTALAPV
jgi:hypothetical protein